MKGDFSRLTFDPAHPFSRVLMQQGRVLLDADWNELNALLLYYLHELAADVMGPYGGPKAELGFEIAAEGEGDLRVFGGRYYVDGRLAALPPKLDGGAPAPAALYSSQPYLPQPPELPAPPYLVYLDVWEWHLTAFENDAIREKALGGPDTSSRAQIVWQVKAAGEALIDKLPGPLTCAGFPVSEFRRALRGRPPLLRARARRPPDADDDPCLTPPDARYRGSENQLYRVEVHRDGAPPTFKWSRENGSVVVLWRKTRGKDLVVEGIRDSVRGFAAGDWVELLDDGRELRGEPGTLALLARVEGDVLTVDPAAVFGDIAPDPSTLVNARIRRWDQKATSGVELEQGAVPVKEGKGEDGWIELENGIAVQFLDHTPDEAYRYRTGDYWLIPARVATGDVEWPRLESNPKDPAPRPPYGIRHHYAPLFLRNGGFIDLRRSWEWLARC
jgi:hypothetical protein